MEVKENCKSFSFQKHTPKKKFGIYLKTMFFFLKCTISEACVHPVFKIERKQRFNNTTCKMSCAYETALINCTKAFPGH